MYNFIRFLCTPLKQKMKSKYQLQDPPGCSKHPFHTTKSYWLCLVVQALALVISSEQTYTGSPPVAPDRIHLVYNLFPAPQLSWCQGSGKPWEPTGTHVCPVQKLQGITLYAWIHHGPREWEPRELVPKGMGTNKCFPLWFPGPSKSPTGLAQCHPSPWPSPWGISVLLPLCSASCLIPGEPS